MLFYNTFYKKISGFFCVLTVVILQIIFHSFDKTFDKNFDKFVINYASFCKFMRNLWCNFYKKNAKNVDKFVINYASFCKLMHDLWCNSYNLSAKTLCHLTSARLHPCALPPQKPSAVFRPPAAESGTSRWLIPVLPHRKTRKTAGDPGSSYENMLLRMHCIQGELQCHGRQKQGSSSTHAVENL